VQQKAARLDIRVNARSDASWTRDIVDFEIPNSEKNENSLKYRYFQNSKVTQQSLVEGK
jgi:hypothetical protein